MSETTSLNAEFRQILTKLPNPHRPVVLTLLTSRQVNFTIENECLVVDVFIDFLVENYQRNQDLIQTLQEAWLRWCNKPIDPNQIEFRHTPELWEHDDE